VASGKQNGPPRGEWRGMGITHPGNAKRGYLVRGAFVDAPPLPPGLYVVATPIGNLSDVTLRALDTLAAADIVACEDTRVTRRLLDRYGIATKVTAYHEHSGLQAHRRLLDALAEGRSIALVSDAGTPLLSDPGSALVADTVAAGHRVIPIPGPSSIVATLSAAGLPTEAFLFVGFLPTKSGARRRRLSGLASVPATLVLFESPNRVAALLADAADVLGDGRAAVLCREVTKIHETFDRGPLAELAARYAGASVKGEVVVLVGPPSAPPAPDESAIDAALDNALRAMSVKEAAQSVAEATGLSRRTLYARALALKGEH
jgi:16S rRNA (cytidine1402-2'-O)-methyltransferase